MLQTILGANGTIGKVLAKELLHYTHQIRLVSRHPKKVNETDELFAADLTDATMVDKAVEGSGIVYLVIGLDYNTKVWQDKWPKLMKATINACIKHKAKLVYFDNMYLYDIRAIGHMVEDSPINPQSKKGLVRKEIAAMLMKEVEAGKLTALIARAPDFYGPDNDRSFIMAVVYKNLLKNKRPNWFIDATKKHTFIYTPDAAKATAILGNTPEAFNQVWHLPADDKSLTGDEWVALFNKEMNTSKKVMVLPMFMLKLLGIFIPLMREMPEMMYQYDRDYFFDSSKFKSHFNFIPTTYEMGVREIVTH